MDKSIAIKPSNVPNVIGDHLSNLLVKNILYCFWNGCDLSFGNMAAPPVRVDRPIAVAVVVPPSMGAGQRRLERWKTQSPLAASPGGVEGIQSELICSKREKRTNTSVAFPLSDWLQIDMVTCATGRSRGKQSQRRNGVRAAERTAVGSFFFFLSLSLFFFANEAEQHFDLLIRPGRSINLYGRVPPLAMQTPQHVMWLECASQCSSLAQNVFIQHCDLALI